MAKVSREVGAELTRAIAERYRTSSKAEKTRILDEYTRLTGYHRKLLPAPKIRRILAVLQARAGRSAALRARLAGPVGHFGGTLMRYVARSDNQIQ